MNQSDRDARTAWFQDARFGLFIHWGLYAVPGGEWRGETMDYIGEWIQAKFRIPNSEYAELAQQFNPTGFDAEEWVVLAKKAGMRYVVFTAKHHDGFAMYGSKVDRYNIVDATPFRRDPLAELASACQKHGLELGLYYSQDLDWHHPDAGDPGPAFPKNYGMSWANDWDYPDLSAKKFERYFQQKALPQITELLTNYGPIALLWFDCPMSISREDSDYLMKMVRELQPACLVNSRVGNGYGDFQSMGDNQVPVNRVKDIWETAATLNDTWGFKYSDENWKSGEDTLAILIGLAASGVNYLLNIGPTPEGRFPQPSIEVLESLARWVGVNSEVIHGTKGSPFASPFSWGWVISRPGTTETPELLYLVFRQRPEGEILLRGLRSPVHSLRAHGASREIPFTQGEEGGLAVLRMQFPEHTSDQLFPVYTLTLDGALDVDGRVLPQQGGRIVIPADQGSFFETGETASIAASASPLVGPAGEITEVIDRPRVNDAGITMNWLSPNYAMEFDFVTTDPGEYTVDVITSMSHGSQWKGGHRLAVEIDGKVLEVTLEADELIKTPDVRYYAQAVSRLGTLTIGKAGIHRATAKAISIRADDGAGLGLVSIVLRPSLP